MKQKLVRINSTDNIEMVGILYEPEIIGNKIVVHVHGLCGNFYETRMCKVVKQRRIRESKERINKIS